MFLAFTKVLKQSQKIMKIVSTGKPSLDRCMNSIDSINNIIYEAVKCIWVPFCVV